MRKLSKIKFTNEDQFLKENPLLAIEEHIPAQTIRRPNLTAIRAILKTGRTLEGVSIIDDDTVYEPHIVGQDGTSVVKKTLGQRLAEGRRAD